MAVDFLFILGLVFTTTFIGLYVYNIVLFLKIRALRNQRIYKGFFLEQMDFLFNSGSFSELVNYLPISRYVKDANDLYKKDILIGGNICTLWKTKFLVELWIAILFVLGIATIPVIEFGF